MSHKDFQDLVRLSESARKALLNQMKRQAAAPAASGKPGGDLRHHQRWDYQGADLEVTVEHIGGTFSRFLAMPRNLSIGGLSFLHGGYLHAGTKCKVELPRVNGQVHSITGVVANCRHVDGRIHEVSVKFDCQIDPTSYRGCDGSAGGGGATASKTSIELPDLRGSVLYIEDSEADNRLLQHHLRASGIQLKCAANGAAALELLGTEPFDIVMCDLNLGSEPGEKVVAEIRRKGFNGPIVAMSAESSAERVKSARAAGANEFLAKPYKPAELFSLMTRLHEQVGAVLDNKGTFSSMQDQPGLPAMIDGYVTQARTIAQQLKTSTLANDLAATRGLCLDLKGSASGYGFEALGTAAAEALKAIDAASSIQQAARELRSLRLLCENVALRRGNDAAGDSPPPKTE